MTSVTESSGTVMASLKESLLKAAKRKGPVSFPLDGLVNPHTIISRG
jgi:hypothetical protein